MARREKKEALEGCVCVIYENSRWDPGEQRVS